MAKIARSALVALALVAGNSAAHAGARAMVSMGGLDLSTTGTASNGFGGFSTGALAPGESRTFGFGYTMTVQEDGLPSSRTNTLCAEFDGGGGFFGGTVCAPPTGYELAQAGLTVGNVNARLPSPFVEISGFTKVLLSVEGPSPDFQTQSGTILITATNHDTQSIRAGSFGFSSFVIVDAVPVPEPETYALLLAGLGLVSWQGKRVRTRPKLRRRDT